MFGATNARFTGGYAEYAVASATKLAKMPPRMGFVEAASAPVVACTAWQMVFEHGAVDATKRVLVHGAAGNVGAYAVQLAKRVAHEVVATALSTDVEYVETLGADRVIDVQKSRFEEVLTDVDVVLDTIGGDTQDRSFAVLKPGGVLVSAVAAPDQQKAARHGVRALFFLVEVSSERLEQIASLIEAGELTTSVGDVLPLSAARTRPRNARGQAAQARKDRTGRRRVPMTCTLQSKTSDTHPRRSACRMQARSTSAALRSCWPKPLGADRVARLSGLQQQGGRRLHESGATADEAVRHSAEAFQQRLNGGQFDTPDRAGPARRRRPASA